MTPAIDPKHQNTDKYRFLIFCVSNMTLGSFHNMEVGASRCGPNNVRGSANTFHCRASFWELYFSTIAETTFPPANPLWRQRSAATSSRQYPQGNVLEPTSSKQRPRGNVLVATSSWQRSRGNTLRQRCFDKKEESRYTQKCKTMFMDGSDFRLMDKHYPTYNVSI